MAQRHKENDLRMPVEPTKRWARTDEPISLSDLASLRLCVDFVRRGSRYGFAWLTSLVAKRM